MEKLSISTERLSIRNLEMTDLTDFHYYRSNPEVIKYQGSNVMTIGEADFISKHKDKLFGKAGNNEVILYHYFMISS